MSPEEACLGRRKWVPEMVFSGYESRRAALLKAESKSPFIHSECVVSQEESNVVQTVVLKQLSRCNHIEVKVTNLWPNRMIGDQQPTAQKRSTFTDYRPYNKGFEAS